MACGTVPDMKQNTTPIIISYVLGLAVKLTKEDYKRNPMYSLKTDETRERH